MSLTRINNPAESVRFLDDLDLTFTLDSRSGEAHQSTSIEITALPIVFRASYRDIMLIMRIVNKAIELYGKSSQPQSQEESKPDSTMALSRPPQPRKISGRATSRTQPVVGNARVVINKEQVHSLQLKFMYSHPLFYSSRDPLKASASFLLVIFTSNRCCTFASSLSSSVLRTGQER